MISSKASIHKKAKIGNNVNIGDFCSVGENVTIGDDCNLINSVNIQGNTNIGKNNTFFPFCSIGTKPQDLKYNNEETHLEIGDNNSFREYSNVSIGTEQGGGITKIKSNCLFMVSSHVGHDCILGNNLVVANNVAIAGHCVFDDDVILGGNSAVLQFTKIGKGAMIGGMTGVDKDVLPYSLVKGNRSYFENINLIGLKRKGFKNSEIEQYKKIIIELFNSNNLKEYISNIKKESELVSTLINFIENKNPNRDICRPLK
ncbi:MAG: acyl-ACP--UDP-N-acetylglucosamine O-acyltransferase [Pelagibacteraceae bacterium]|jgi:UDP-N-acetylglucosamine acyltransferase|nr:acyl-ACP--UDP-N-acetylglucosamine O-acyltransferase [Pelagibacteraceae bacterium]MCI5079145.1 acyl-ACP--UDP-N-acetylglucosamine O-acyltransferase [Pelagibacteraceae bacterium]